MDCSGARLFGAGVFLAAQLVQASQCISSSSNNLAYRNSPSVWHKSYQHPDDHLMFYCAAPAQSADGTFQVGR